MNKAPSDEFTKACKDAEFFETDIWAAERILDVELLTERVLDPCAGRGVLGDALVSKGYNPKNIAEIDLNIWPEQPGRIAAPINFLHEDVHDDLHPLCNEWAGKDFSVMMNPPFSLACEFVLQSLDLGARKVIMFQRMAWMESARRSEFFKELPPARIWVCGDRATCWRGDIPDEDVLDEDGKVICKGKKGRSASTPHAWFVWERAHNGVMAMHHLYKR